MDISSKLHSNTYQAAGSGAPPLHADWRYDEWVRAASISSPHCTADMQLVLQQSSGHHPYWGLWRVKCQDWSAAVI